MRRTLIIGFSVALLGAAAFGQSSRAEPSLGDVARQQRADKKAAPKRVITNEDLPSSSSGVTVAPSPAGGAAPTRDLKDSKDAKKPADVAHADAPSKTPVDADYRAQIQKQRVEIAKLEKEVADLQHKQQVQSTNAYMDAGARLRDPKAWTDQRDKLDKDIATRQQKLQDARVKLDDLFEQARKLGISTASLE
jgi:Skp family chaperone for outer membrane proteins